MRSPAGFCHMANSKKWSGSEMPASWRTLYELTRLSDEQFTAGIESRDIDELLRAAERLGRRLRTAKILPAISRSRKAFAKNGRPGHEPDSHSHGHVAKPQP
jgi:hypothetical protein